MKIGIFLQTDIVKDNEGYFEGISSKKYTTLETNMACLSNKYNNKNWKTLWMCIWHQGAVNRGLAIYTNPTKAVKFPLQIYSQTLLGTNFLL